jgi:hypothetical protein
MPHWDAIKRRRRVGRVHRRAKAMEILPAVKTLCERYTIAISCNDHGYQFRKAEYVVLWHPGTNKVVIQYRLRGHGDTVLFAADNQSRPKIVEALLRLIKVTNG